MSTTATAFKQSATQYCLDLDHRQRIRKALTGYEAKRDENQARFQSWEDARQVAAEIKYEVINHLDQYLELFEKNLKARGVQVHWACDAKEARDCIVQIAQANNVRQIIKSKSMTSEEIHLNEALEKNGFDVFESDLGEFIVQLRNEPPYHLVFPSMHLTRHQISETFVEKLGSERVTEPAELTMIARRLMRQKFCQADLGISGVNFGVAETGMISITENEGNARLTTSLPRIHVALMGIEKMVRRLDDLALFLPMLATAGAGQALTGYNTLYGAAKLPGEPDGPEQFHVVLLDNGRTAMLADAEHRDSLHCIRCGACLNVCPIFRNVGGHTYGTVYGGPIGSVITPHLRGLQEWKHLSYSSSLCGACSEACPVKIDLHHHLLQNRRNATRQKASWWQKLAFKLFAPVANGRLLWSLVTRFGRLGQRLHPLILGTRLDPAYVWTKTRDLPPIAKQSFKEWWRDRP